MSDEDLKRLLQKAGFMNGRGHCDAEGNLSNFRALLSLVGVGEAPESLNIHGRSPDLTSVTEAGYFFFDGEEICLDGWFKVEHLELLASHINGFGYKDPR